MAFNYQVGTPGKLGEPGTGRWGGGGGARRLSNQSMRMLISVPEDNETLLVLKDGIQYQQGFPLNSVPIQSPTPLIRSVSPTLGFGLLGLNASATARVISRR